MKTIGQQAQEFREVMGWTRTRMAAEVSRHAAKTVSRQAITQLEEVGDRRPHYLSALAKTMRTTVETLEAGKYIADKEKLTGALAAEIQALDSAWAEGDGVDPRPVVARHPEDTPPAGMVEIPESTLAFSAGPGATMSFELVDDSEPVIYQLSWFQKMHISPDTVRRFKVKDDSAEPLAYEGDSILVNHAETEIIDGKVYAFRYGGDLRVKKLYRRLDGTLILRSINPAYKDEEVPPALAQEHITIIGRVRDKAGPGGL
jgi:DNA-binding XRE family transcriptional regulator